MVGAPRTTRRVVWLVVITNAVAAALSTVTPVVSIHERPPGYVTAYAMLQIVFVTLAFTVNPIIVTRRVRAAIRPGAPVEGIAAVPMLCTVVTVVTWLLAAVCNATLAASHNVRPVVVVGVGLRSVLAGISAGAVVYLLTERAIAPLREEVLTSEQSSQSRYGLRVRLVVAWVAGSALPVLLFGSALFGRTAEERADIAGYGWLYVALALVFGAGMTLAMAESVARPIEVLRATMQRVETGDLDVRVNVDDGTEIGQLQNGFNRMVSGLRERQRLHDLFGRHVGEEVARLALERPDGGVRLGGELCEATALFVDLTGSTTLGERLPPDEIVAILNEFFAEVVAAVTAEGGWVNKFEGDAALCVFGPPVGYDDHALRAMRAAVAMREGLRRFQERHDGLDAGIGVATGQVVAGNVGAEERYEYTVIGDPVNSAARVTDLAKTADARVLVTGATYDAAGHRAGWEAVGETVLRGRKAPTQLFAPCDAAAPGL